jgi:hypothetical protein
MPKVSKSQLVELVVPGVAGGNNQTKIQFNDQPYLRGKIITGVEILTSNDCSASPTGKTVISGAQMLKSFLTLYLDDMRGSKNVGEWIQNVPFALMHRVQNNVIPATALPAAPGVQYFDPYVRGMYEIDSQVIYWEKCYVSLSSAFANTTDVSFLFNVYFK